MGRTPPPLFRALDHTQLAIVALFFFIIFTAFHPLEIVSCPFIPSPLFLFFPDPSLPTNSHPRCRSRLCTTSLSPFFPALTASPASTIHCAIYISSIFRISFSSSGSSGVENIKSK